MPLFPLRSRIDCSSVWPLGALLLSVGAPARAQDAPDPDPGSSAAPQLTGALRPISTITASQRPKFPSAAVRRSLVIAVPTAESAATAPATAPVIAPVNLSVAPLVQKTVSVQETLVSAPPSIAQSGNSSPQTLISPAKRIHVASKSRFAASRVSAQSVIGPSSSASPAVKVAAPSLGSPQALSSVDSVAPLPPVEATSPRDRMARLPSRGGLAQNRAPVALQTAPPETRTMSEAQRRLLAQLDADLGRAQRRLDRAETRLTEGQRQLGNFTGVLRSAMLDAGDDARGLHPFVRVAQRYMGTPYVWGGESARGFDCSGFIMRVMRDLGYKALPHSAAEQFRYGQPVAKSLLKPGDIVFFANTYKPGVSHVGIYLGRNRFIHAANSQDGTIVSGLDEPKWIQHYAGARRLLRVNS